MVSGCALPVTNVPGTNQCAETASTARGLGSAAPSARKPRDQRLSSIAFIGEPWPMKTAGMRGVALDAVGWELGRGDVDMEPSGAGAGERWQLEPKALATAPSKNARRSGRVLGPA